VTIADNIIEDSVPFEPFKDLSPTEVTCFYRMRACNIKGMSAFSNVEVAVYRTSIKNI